MSRELCAVTSLSLCERVNMEHVIPILSPLLAGHVQNASTGMFPGGVFIRCLTLTRHNKTPRYMMFFTAIIPISKNNIVLTKSVAWIWEHRDLTMTKPDTARNTSQLETNAQVSQIYLEEKMKASSKTSITVYRTTPCFNFHPLYLL